MKQELDPSNVPQQKLTTLTSFHQNLTGNQLIELETWTSGLLMSILNGNHHNIMQNFK